MDNTSRSQARLQWRPFGALREVLASSYTRGDFIADVRAGAVVGMVALPLSMVMAIASGAAPQHGIYTVIVAGAMAALFGGSRFQVSGPTAALVVILSPISHEFGIGGLLLAGMMAGGILVVMGLARLGKMISFIPYPVTTGFTAGIAVVIATLQLKDFFGLQVAAGDSHILSSLESLWAARGTVSWWEAGLGAATVAGLLIWPKLSRKIPAPLIVLTASTVVAVAVHSCFPEVEFATVRSRFFIETAAGRVQGIPQAPPSFQWPWLLPGPGGEPLGLSLATLRNLLPSSLAIAMLGAIASLLSAVVADGMTGTRHDPDAELVAQGLGNLLCPFFGGIAATGAIARTATNIRYGARSPLSAVMHAAIVLAIVLLFAPWVSFLPMAAMAALLLVVSWNMADLKHLAHLLKAAPGSDVAVFLCCFILTVVFDMVIGVSVGVVLAALLFMQRMSTITQGETWSESGGIRGKSALPSDVVVYEIAGPLFFGAAQQAMNSLHIIHKNVRTLVLVLRQVPVMDVTGLVALESAVGQLSKRGVPVLIVGLRPQPMEVLRKSDLMNGDAKVYLCASWEEAELELALLRGFDTLIPAGSVG